MKNIAPNAALRLNPAIPFRAELARKIASFIGNEENRITEIPGVSLHRRIAPTPPCRTTYQPGIIVVAQGSKQVNLGKSSFIYDEAHYLLTAVDLPIVSWVAQATPEFPCLVLSLKLDISMVRELLSREEIHVGDAPSDSPAMSIGETTPEFLSACCRLLDLLNNPQDISFLSGLIQREIIYRILRGPEGARLRSVATLGDQSHRTAKAIAWIAANYSKTLRVEELAELSSMGVSTLHHHFRMLTSMSPLQYQKQLRLQSARNLILDRNLTEAWVPHPSGLRVRISKYFPTRMTMVRNPLKGFYGRGDLHFRSSTDDPRESTRIGVEARENRFEVGHA